MYRLAAMALILSLPLRGQTESDARNLVRNGKVEEGLAAWKSLATRSRIRLIRR